MNFSKALELLKEGKKLNRIGWNNTNIWIELQKPDVHSKMTKPYLFMCKYNDRFPCDLSCESIMAEDWEVIEKVEWISNTYNSDENLIESKKEYMTEEEADLMMHSITTLKAVKELIKQRKRLEGYKELARILDLEDLVN